MLGVWGRNRGKGEEEEGNFCLQIFIFRCGTYEQLEYWANNFNDFAVSRQYCNTFIQPLLGSFRFDYEYI